MDKMRPASSPLRCGVEEKVSSGEIRGLKKGWETEEGAGRPDLVSR
jgi:hypothetical protein